MYFQFLAFLIFLFYSTLIERSFRPGILGIYFLSFPHKNNHQRKLRQTKRSVFNSYTKKFRLSSTFLDFLCHWSRSQIHLSGVTDLLTTGTPSTPCLAVPRGTSANTDTIRQAKGAPFCYQKKPFGTGNLAKLVFFKNATTYQEVPRMAVFKPNCGKKKETPLQIRECVSTGAAGA
jgi:hypothetical protein